MTKMKIIWLSANLFGLRLLEEAVKHTDISAIITLSDKSNTIMYDSVNRKRWNKFNIDVHEIEDINKEIGLLKNLDPDIIIMCGWRQLLSKEVLSIPKKGFIGFHPTLLPIGRGSAPIINSILNGFEIGGVSMFYVSEGLDNGDIIAQRSFKIDINDHAKEVYNKCISAGKWLISSNLYSISYQKLTSIKQDLSKGSVFVKPSLKDNKIDLEKESIERIYNKIKALSKPYQGAYIEKDGKRLIIWKAELVNNVRDV